MHYAVCVNDIYYLEDHCVGDIVQTCRWLGPGTYTTRLSDQTYVEIHFISISFMSLTLNVLNLRDFQQLQIDIDTEDGMSPCDHVTGGKNPYTVVLGTNLATCVRMFLGHIQYQDSRRNLVIIK